ncbi:MAG: FAD-dependent oxidoreductase [Tannerella sp.]|jgi:hypothetical protein|nr:FAD-dependent oxidoreductase [Tannerella sp.]
MKKQLIVVSLILFACLQTVRAADFLLEAESFENKGGWVLDQQFMDIMGSPYLMAHGLGKPVADAETTITLPEKGIYYIYVRTYNWTSPWKKAEGPGKFKVSVDGKKLSNVLGTAGSEWMWQLAGKVSVRDAKVNVKLHDLTGFNGRCDAIYFTTKEGNIPPVEMESLNRFRKQMLQLPGIPVSADKFDLVVVGGGIAGISAAVSAARLGCKVALIHDRPVLGGNNSSEVRVHLGGRIETGIYKELGNLQKEFGPVKKGNAQPAAYYEDEKKEIIVANEKNITLFRNYRATEVFTENSVITNIVAVQIETGEELSFAAQVFADCTGDGTIGYLAGAHWRMGRESREEFAEETAPEKADDLTMGASVQWYSENADKPDNFPHFSYGVEFNEENSEKVTMGEWTWETGMNYDQITDFERIRDYGLMVVFSNWSFLKNEYSQKDKYKNIRLSWVAYISGKRESRRLMGDYILKEDDLRKYIVHEDATAATTWTIDLHYPDPKNTKYFPDEEFKSIAKHIPIYPYPIPYRCLYSRNINNLFMAGRNISVTHVALGTTRVMRTTGMMGEVVGMAAFLCKKYGILPRTVYWSYLDELKRLMNEGVGKKGLINNQKYNEGSTLKEPPVLSQ